MTSLNWNQFAGGTSAAEGKHGYTAHHEHGEYHIQPISTRRGLHSHYSVSFANTKGKLNGGLWHHVGDAPSPNRAKQMATAHHSEHFGENATQHSEESTEQFTEQFTEPTPIALHNSTAPLAPPIVLGGISSQHSEESPGILGKAGWKESVSKGSNFRRFSHGIHGGITVHSNGSWEHHNSGKLIREGSSHIDLSKHIASLK